MLTRWLCSLQNTIYSTARTVSKDEKGITAIEYAALAVGLAALITMLTGEDGEISKAIKAAFENVTSTLSKG